MLKKQVQLVCTRYVYSGFAVFKTVETFIFAMNETGS